MKQYHMRSLMPLNVHSQQVLQLSDDVDSPFVLKHTVLYNFIDRIVGKQIQHYKLLTHARIGCCVLKYLKQLKRNASTPPPFFLINKIKFKCEVMVLSIKIDLCVGHFKCCMPFNLFNSLSIVCIHMPFVCLSSVHVSLL